MKILKRKIITITLRIGFIVVLLMSSCDDGFKEMNKNPNAFIEPSLNNMLTYSLIEAAGGPGYTNHPLYWNLKLCGCFMQYFASLDAWFWTGDKYLKKPGYDDQLYNNMYRVQLKEIEQLLSVTKNKPDLINYYSVGRIMKVYLFHRLTDFYGDVPYFEAGKGYLESKFNPKFDRQAVIYADMLKELEEAAKGLDLTIPTIGSADLLYSGNQVQWKRFAYSLMLRLGMRLTKVDPFMAETWVKKAIAGGVMQNNSDIAKVPHQPGTYMNVYPEANDVGMSGSPGVPISKKGNGQGKMAKAFVDHLKSTNDPRLPFYITLWEGNADPSQLPISTISSKQEGLPSGYDYTSIKEVIPDWNSSINLPKISEINLNTVASLSTPTILQSYAEVELLLAEAALRGWGPGSVNAHYENAVKASMEVETLYPGGISVSPASINMYLSANPISGTFEQQMMKIHTEFWVSLFMNNIEVWSNYRRTGYPILVPTNYPGNETGGTIPRRVPYSTSEAVINTTNYKEAIAAQGPDLFTTRVWWDKL